MKDIIPSETIVSQIYLFRGQKVMIDRDLAELYGVSTGVLNQAVRRNIGRFPADFMFQLTVEEMKSWISQIVISKNQAKGFRKRPLAFTEQGVAMLSSVLKSERAIQVNIQIIRTFTRMRALIAENEFLTKKIEALEMHYDEQFKIVFDAIRRMIKDEPSSDETIGFRTE